MKLKMKRIETKSIMEDEMKGNTQKKKKVEMEV